MIRALVLLAMLFCAENASAQCMFCFDPLDLVPPLAFVVLEPGLLVSSVVAAVGSTKYATPGWFGTSYVVGALNGGMAMLALYGAAVSRPSYFDDPGGTAFLVTLAAVHGSLFLWNFIAPAVAMRADEHEPPPVVVTGIGGRGPSGRRWLGVALQLASF